jgi:hypothetical protein
MTESLDDDVTGWAVGVSVATFTFIVVTSDFLAYLMGHSSSTSVGSVVRSS